jgi:hypothetical protein
MKLIQENKRDNIVLTEFWKPPKQAVLEKNKRRKLRGAVSICL